VLSVLVRRLVVLTVVEVRWTQQENSLGTNGAGYVRSIDTSVRRVGRDVRGADSGTPEGLGVEV
jgi:hypothetical protein